LAFLEDFMFSLAQEMFTRALQIRPQDPIYRFLNDYARDNAGKYLK
jgi:hypothetical protein